MREAIDEAIVEALVFASGNREIAAAMLQIGRTTIHRKLKRIEIKDREWTRIQRG